MEKLSRKKEVGGLGLRKLGAINLAMLAKQVWRIIMKPDALLSRILKHKYFSSTDVFQAVAGSGCSFTWRSIISARNMVSAGFRWQVGNGHSVKIRTDKWVPRPWTFKVLTAQNTLGWDATVSELLSEEGEWNEEFMQTVFRPEDIGAINGISPCRGTPDKLRWHFEKHGRYEVKSTYHLFCTGTVPNSLSSFTGSSSRKPEGWSFIWSDDVSPRVRLFAWRACRDSLPTSSNLARRGVTQEGVCPWCGTEGEDLFHTLFLSISPVSSGLFPTSRGAPSTAHTLIWRRGSMVCIRVLEGHTLFASCLSTGCCGERVIGCYSRILPHRRGFCWSVLGA
ncbi:UNVERIFIED_CONTAM: hypothetical protein Sradi_7189600 [Sesamum radiatum]|uniref:Reverse transcriptase zinc-binding domain-containing protein n=1 Tax=Sesamum radiatum TaxID=300843 RepID=A0AAW2ISD8_SESRA